MTMIYARGRFTNKSRSRWIYILSGQASSHETDGHDMIMIESHVNLVLCLDRICRHKLIELKVRCRQSTVDYRMPANGLITEAPNC